MARVILLRDENARPEQPGKGSGDIVRPAISVETLGPCDLRDTARDPGILAMARVMPTRLIEPEPLDDIRENEAVTGWGIRATGAQDSELTGVGTRIALLDTGVDADHPAFRGVTLVRRDFAGTGNHDANGHGTHCAATILGRDVDGVRIGMARGITTAMLGKVVDDSGHGSSDMLLNGLLWAAGSGAQIACLSVAFDTVGLSELLVEQGYPLLLAASIAVDSHRSNLRLIETFAAMLQAPDSGQGGPLIIAAAGNDSRRQVAPDFEVGVSAPASAKGVLSVGALGQGEGGLIIAPFSNTAPTIAAPGVGIVSATSDGGLRTLNGTAQAAAHVAGAAALWSEALSAQAPAPASAIRAALLATAQHSGLAPPASPFDLGRGLVQVPPRRSPP